MPFDPSTAKPVTRRFDPSTAKPVPSFSDVYGAADVNPQYDETTRAGPAYRPDVLPASDSSFGASFKAELVRDPQTQLRVVADSLFPNDPNGINRVGVVGGRLVKVNDGGKLEYVSGKGTEFIAGLAANAPEMVAGTAGALSPAPVVGSTLGVAGARGLKDAAVGLIFDEPQTVTGNLKDVGTQAGINAVTAGIAKGATALVNRGRVVDFTPGNLADAQAVQQTVKARFGIDLNLAQASQDPRLIQMWKYVARYPGKSAEVVDLADTLQRGQVDDAMTKLLDMSGNGYPAPILGQTAIDVSRTTIKRAQQKLSAEVRPLYEAAYAEVPSVSDPAITELLARPTAASAVEKARTMLANEGIAYKPGQLDLRLLDKTKQALDDSIEVASRAGNRNEARVIAGQRDQLVKYLDSVSNQKYAEARSAYQAGMKTTVEPLQKGLVGILAGIKDPKAATAALRVFRDPNIGPREILQAKGAILQQKGGDEAWDGLVRQYLAKTWDLSSRVAQSGEVINPTGKFAQQIAGRPSAEANLRAMLGEERGQLAMDLMAVFRKIGSTTVGGSDTAFNQEIRRGFSSGTAQTVRTITAPRQTALEAVDLAAVKGSTGKIAEALSNPAKVKLLRTVVKMPDGVKKTAMLGAILGVNLVRSAAATGASADGDRIPSSYTPPLQ